MTVPKPLTAIVEALRSAGATEEIIALAVKAFGDFEKSPTPRGGRPRKHADDTARKRAWKKGRRNGGQVSSPSDETGDETPALSPDGDEIRDEIPMARRMALGPALRGRLEEAGQGRVTRAPS
jgi:hypothetical protein